MLHGLSARRCLMSPHFLTGWTSRLLGLALVSWAFVRVAWRPSSFPLPSIPWCVLHSLSILHLTLNFIRVSSLRLMYMHSMVDPSLTHFFRWVFRIGTGSGTRCRGPRGGVEVRVHEAKISFHCVICLCPYDIISVIRPLFSQGGAPR